MLIITQGLVYNNGNYRSNTRNDETNGSSAYDWGSDSETLVPDTSSEGDGEADRPSPTRSGVKFEPDSPTYF